MELKTLVNREERAVSPVIGVILMVAITVILAAVIGAFVLGIGGDMAQTPNANLGVDADTDYQASDGDRLYTVDHNGGDSLQTDDIRMIIRDDSGDRVATLDTINNGEEYVLNETNNVALVVDYTSGADTFGVGDRLGVTLRDSGGDLASDSGVTQGDEITVQLIHKPSDGVVTERTITLAN